MSTPDRVATLEKGRSQIKLVILLLVGMEIAVQVLTDLVGAATPDRMLRQMGRLLVTVLLAYYLFHGRSWAKWVLVVLSALGAVTAGGAVAVAVSGGVISGTPFLVAMAVVYLTVVRILVRSKAANAFLAAQRDARSNGDADAGTPAE